MGCPRIHEGWRFVSGFSKTIARQYFQLGSDPNHLTVFFLQFGFKIFPIVTCFIVIILIGQHGNNIQYRKPPFRVFFVPDSTNFSVVKKRMDIFSSLIFSCLP